MLVNITLDHRVHTHITQSAIGMERLDLNLPSEVVNFRNTFEINRITDLKHVFYLK